MTDPHTEGIHYIDDRVDEENNDINRDAEESKPGLHEDSDTRREDDPSALHINRVNLAPRDHERAYLRVCVEITHPALKLPVYLTWTGERLRHTFLT